MCQLIGDNTAVLGIESIAIKQLDLTILRKEDCLFEILNLKVFTAEAKYNLLSHFIASITYVQVP